MIFCLIYRFSSGDFTRIPTKKAFLLLMGLCAKSPLMGSALDMRRSPRKLSLTSTRCSTVDKEGSIEIELPRCDSVGERLDTLPVGYSMMVACS